jgi:hypothetical protein
VFDGNKRTELLLTQRNGYCQKKNTQQFVVSLTEGAGCVLPGSEQCCYRTAELQNKDVVLA